MADSALKNLVAILIGITIVVVTLMCFVYFARYSSGELAFTTKFKEIEIGSRIENALDILGPQYEISEKFYLGQRQGFEAEYERAEQSESEKYYIWQCCIDMTYAIGINKEGVIRVVEYGGT